MSYQRSKYLNGDSLNKNNENSNQSVNFSSLLAGENLSNPQIIEAVKESSLRYRFYNWTQNIKLMHYSRFMVIMIILLAVYSDTIFSFVLIIILCAMMYSSNTFLNVQQARSHLVSIINKYLIPLILFEIVLSMIYQMPLSFLEPGQYSILD